MKITCTQENLKKGLSVVSPITTQDGSLPVLGNILIKTEAGQIKLAATNLEVGVTIFINGKIFKEGSVTVPARLINDYVNSLPNKNIDLEVKNNELSLKCSDYNAKIKGINPEEFPIIPKVKNEPVIDLDSNLLQEGINQTIFASALDESRPEITGVYFEVDKEKTVLAATDSFRLAEKSINKKSKAKEVIKAIIPSRTLYELNRILTDFSGEIKISLSESQVAFVFDNVNFVSRLVEGQYPDYKQIIPAKSLTETKVNLKDLTSVVKATSLFARKGGNDIDLEFSPSRKEIAVSAVTAQVGENKAKVKAEVNGQAGRITFNFKYLLDGLANINSPKVTLGFSGAGAPGVLKGDGNPDYTYIIMPIKQ